MAAGGQVPAAQAAWVRFQESGLVMLYNSQHRQKTSYCSTCGKWAECESGHIWKHLGQWQACKDHNKHMKYLWPMSATGTVQERFEWALKYCEKIVPTAQEELAQIFAAEVIGDEFHQQWQNALQAHNDAKQGRADFLNVQEPAGRAAEDWQLPGNAPPAPGLRRVDTDERIAALEQKVEELQRLVQALMEQKAEGPQPLALPGGPWALPAN